KLSSPIAKQRRIDIENEDYFNILGLPNELISHTFSFLSIKDRMRVRVNKKLDGIELDSQYFVEKLLITDMKCDKNDQVKFFKDETMIFI
ncbi:hypothetical protein PENTCL1PPCAC_5625, partial [Pristionchus entomophagus]